MDSSHGFNGFLDQTREFLREINELSLEVEEQLRAYGDVDRKLEVLSRELPAGDRNNILVVKKVCEDVVFSAYILLKNKTATLSITVRQIEENESKLPEILQPKATEIKGYYAKIRLQINKADNLLKEIEEKLKEVEKKDFNITRAERIKFQMMQTNLDTCLQIASEDHKNAETALSMFGDGITQYLKETLGKTVCLTALGAAAGAGVGYAAGRSMVLSAAAGGGLVAFLGGLYFFQQRDKLNCHYEKLSSMLRDLKSDHVARCKASDAVGVKVGYVTAP